MDAGLRGPSRTALMAAMARALHRDGSPPQVLDDWMAADLAGEEGRAILHSMLANAPPDRMHAFQAWGTVRSRFVEDFVESAVAAGISQYVMLGAGLDSFAYRHADLLERLTIFEVDHPFSQAWKRRRLYLARDSIDATLETIARCAPGTRAVFSYDQPPDVLDEKGRGLLAEVSGTAAKYGEPFISLFRRDEIEQLLAEHGFDSVVQFGAEEAVRYFGGKDVGVPDLQRLVTAVVAG